MFRGINAKDVSWAKLKFGNLEQSSDDAGIAGLAPTHGGHFLQVYRAAS
jgi:hypothetical protein